MKEKKEQTKIGAEKLAKFYEEHVKKVPGQERLSGSYIDMAITVRDRLFSVPDMEAIITKFDKDFICLQGHGCMSLTTCHWHCQRAPLACTSNVFPMEHCMFFHLEIKFLSLTGWCLHRHRRQQGLLMTLQYYAFRDSSLGFYQAGACTGSNMIF